MVLDFRASQLRGAKLIASGSTGTGATLLFYPIAAEGTPANQGNISPTKFVTGSIGTDIFLFVSGGIDQKGTASSNAITAFGGDVHISGSLTSVKISGSIQKLADGSSYLRAGDNITIVTQANGSIAISGSAAAGVQWPESSTVPRIRTTASVYIGSGAFFAEDVASSSFFYVSGASGGNFVGVNRFAVLPDTAMSGNLLFISSSSNLIPKIYGNGGLCSIQFSGSNLAVINTVGKIGIGNSTTIPGGSDIAFSVSGTINGNAAALNKALLPDTIISGNLHFKSSSINPFSIIHNGNRDGGIAFSGSFVQVVSPTMFGISYNLITSQPNNSDVFLFVSGTKNGSFGKIALLPDTMISGALRIDSEENSPSSITFWSGSVGPAFIIQKDSGVAWSIENLDTGTPIFNFNLNTSATGGSAEHFGFYGRAIFVMGLTGALHKLLGGESYLSGNQIRVVTQSTGQIVLSGGYISITSQSANFTLSEQDQIIHISTTGSHVSISLPSPPVARQFLISKTVGSSSVVLLSGSFAINGSVTNYVMPGSDSAPTPQIPQSWLVYGDTVNWFVR